MSTAADTLYETDFYAECPWTFEHIMDEQFWPTAATQTSTS